MHMIALTDCIFRKFYRYVNIKYPSCHKVYEFYVFSFTMRDPEGKLHLQIIFLRPAAVNF